MPEGGPYLQDYSSRGPPRLKQNFESQQMPALTNHDFLKVVLNHQLKREDVVEPAPVVRSLGDLLGPCFMAPQLCIV